MISSTSCFTAKGRKPEIYQFSNFVLPIFIWFVSWGRTYALLYLKRCRTAKITVEIYMSHWINHDQRRFAERLRAGGDARSYIFLKS